MELGETLTITAVITSTTYLATRAKNNSEVTIRISHPGGSPTIHNKRNTPRSPPPSLSGTATKTPTGSKLDLEPQLPADRGMMQGWAMVTTQPQTVWDIAWVCTTTFPVPKISVMLESELNAKPCVPSKFEEIESIVEVESLLASDGMEKTEPLKFEITTKTSSTYRIIPNNFMTNGLRRLKASLAAPETLPSPNPNLSQLDSPTPKNMPRISTPKPPLPVGEKSCPSQLDLSAKRPVSRTNTPVPASTPSPPGSLLARTVRLLQHRSASYDVIPQGALNVKPPPRPVSLNVSDLIKNLDTPKRNDPRSFLKMHSIRSRVARRPSAPHKVAVVPPIMISKRILRTPKSDDESEFSDCDDVASNFSEDMDDNSLKERSPQPMKTSNPLNCSDPEIRDLCERTKGLSPDINFILQFGSNCSDSDSDASSCFSEDSEDENAKEDGTRETPRGEEFSDSMSDSSAMSSSVSSSGIFDGIAVGKSDPGIRGLQKAQKLILKKTDSETLDKRKSLKAEKLEKKKRDKEAKAAARQSKKLEKKREHKEKEKDEKKEHKEHDDKHSESGKLAPSLNVRMKSWLRLFGKIGATSAPVEAQ